MLLTSAINYLFKINFCLKRIQGEELEEHNTIDIKEMGVRTKERDQIKHAKSKC